MVVWPGDETEEAGLDTAHPLWANELLPGQLAQIVPWPQDFEAASSLVSEQLLVHHPAPDGDRRLARPPRTDAARCRSS